LGLDVAGVPKKEGNDRARRYLTQLGLADRARARPETLSGGMKQRVAIARALAVEPDVLLMDEPFASLDAQLRTMLQEQLLVLWQKDRRTVVFITHSLEEAILLGDRVVVMSARPGRMLKSIDIPFERPRSAEIRLTHEFVNLQADLWDLLRREVEAHLAEQVGIGSAHA
jgi:NitT/TauT family transport system ATP-binding protein